MKTKKTFYEKLPKSISVPDEFTQKKGEVVITVEDNAQKDKNKLLKDFYGLIPDLPERSPQGTFERREKL